MGPCRLSYWNFVELKLTGCTEVLYEHNTNTILSKWVLNVFLNMFIVLVFLVYGLQQVLLTPTTDKEKVHQKVIVDPMLLIV